LPNEIDGRILQLDQQFEQFFKQGKYLQAIEVCTQLESLIRENKGDDNLDFAKCLNNKAEMYRKMCKYSDAENLFLKSLQVMSKILTEDHPDYLRTLANLAKTYKDRGDYFKAGGLYRKVLEARRKYFDQNRLDVAISLNDLAGLYYDVGDYDEALSLYTQAHIICQEIGQQNSFFATILNNLAAIYEEKGIYATAESYYRKALKLRLQVLGENHPDFAASLDNLALFLYAKGDYTESKKHQDQAVELRRQVLGENHPDFAASLNNLAMRYDALCDYEQAQSLYVRANNICRNTFGEDHPLYIKNLNNLGESYRKTRNYAKAEELLLRAIKICENRFGQDHPDLASTQNNLAVLYECKGDYEKAEELLRRVLEIRRKMLPKNHLHLALTMNNLGALCRTRGKYAEAEELLLRSFDIYKETFGDSHPDCVAVLRNISDLYIAAGRHGLAIDYMERTARFEDNLIGQLFSVGSERQRMISLLAIRRSFYAFLTLVINLYSTSSDIVKSAFDLTLRRKSLTAEAFAAQRDAVLARRYPQLEPKFKELNLLRMQITQKTLSGPNIHKGISDHYNLLNEWKSNKESLESQLANSIPEVMLEEVLRKSNCEAIVKELSDADALIEFVKFDPFDFGLTRTENASRWKPAKYIAFVLHKGDPVNVHLIDLGPAETIDRLIKSLKLGIIHEAEFSLPTEMPSIESNSFYYGTELRKVLFDPLKPVLKDHTNLFIAPDGSLYNLPFEVLPTTDGLRLIDEYHITYLTTGRDLMRFRSAPVNSYQTDPVVIADPDYDLASGMPETVSCTTVVDPIFRRLEWTGIEGQRIAELLQVQPWMGCNALESRLKKLVSPRILHLATHGFFSPTTVLPTSGVGNQSSINQLHINKVEFSDTPIGNNLHNPMLKSGLVLAGFNTSLKKRPLPADAEDGILTAEDISGLNLSNTELVVLSACETGLGDIQDTEGVFGMRRAFVLAGAKTLIMSLWKVADKQTQELMVGVYRRILSGQHRAEALRKAQLDIRKKYPKPYYWGAFICQGNSSPLPDHGHRQHK